MWAVLSDVHSNLEALTAVLADIDRHGVDRVICLGDIVGYGPDPLAAVDLIRSRCAVTIMGNHDHGAMFDPVGWSAAAERAIYWTREQLERAPTSREQREARWEFLSDLPKTHQEGGKLFVHGSARSPLNEYVFPDDIYNQRKMSRIFALVDRVCFQGHTHVPGVFTELLVDDTYGFVPSHEVETGYELGGRKQLVNVGSVGQPRDGDPRACYVLLDGDFLTYRRVDYDIEATARKIYAVPELENFLGDRLKDGR